MHIECLDGQKELICRGESLSIEMTQNAKQSEMKKIISGYAADYFVWPTRRSIGVLGMDFERILKMHFFKVISASSLCAVFFVKPLKIETYFGKLDFFNY